jgi:hypothetical protein
MSQGISLLQLSIYWAIVPLFFDLDLVRSTRVLSTPKYCTRVQVCGSGIAQLLLEWRSSEKRSLLSLENRGPPIETTL